MSNRTGRELVHTAKSPVTIKGVRDGLVFLLNEQCSFEEILENLEQKIHGDQGQLLAGPVIRVAVHTGERQLTVEQVEAVRSVLAVHSNLVINEFSGTNAAYPSNQKQAPLVHYGTVRSGQRIDHKGDIVIVGDVNPGGEVIAAGDVMIMGSLRGLAHAGVDGDETTIIAAVYFQPTQLRISTVISRSPDSNQVHLFDGTEMEFAYLRDGQMAVDKLCHLHNIRTR